MERSRVTEFATTRDPLTFLLDRYEAVKTKSPLSEEASTRLSTSMYSETARSRLAKRRSTTTRFDKLYLT